MTYKICSACMDGAHSECEGHGCYCDCQLEPVIRARHTRAKDSRPNPLGKFKARERGLRIST